MFSATLREWKRKIGQLQQRWRAVRQENERLRKENEALQREKEQLERKYERLRKENDHLRRQLEEAQRANKRQAAPFSRGKRKEHPKTPGRKPGAAYGQQYCKLPPQQVDEVISVPLPEQCSCGGHVVFDRIEFQYQQEIVRKPSGGASISRSVIVRGARNGGKGGTRDRPPRPWERPRCSWDPTRWRWGSG